MGSLAGLKVDDQALRRIEGMICSMTLDERRRPQILNASRRKRIAAGSGTTVQDLNRLLKQFSQVQELMKRMGSGGFGGMGGGMGRGGFGRLGRLGMR
jgi:signal recognition particle subunit SRP54